MPFSLTAMFLMLTCCIPATIAVCEGSSVIGKEGNTAEFSGINRRSSVIFHWSLNKDMRYIANVRNNHVDDIIKPERYHVSTNSSHIFITIIKVSIDDSGLYIVHGMREETLEVIRLSVEGTDVVTEVDTVITRRGSTVRFPVTVNPCRHLFFRPTDTSSSGKFFKSNNYTSIGCSDSIIANEEQEGCYVMVSFGDIYIQRIQLSDIKITVMLDRISCVEDPPASGIPFWLEHQYNESTIRKVEDNGSATLPVLPKPYHNNGIYQCITYIDNSKSAISQNKSFVYEFTGLPVFAEGNRYLLQGEYGRNLSMTVLVYSNPNITEIKVNGENRSTDGFLVHEIKTLPAFLNGWHGPNANIPGWEIIIDIVFQVPQNITLYVIVGNTIGYNKFRMKALVGEPTTPDDSSLYSFISVATCILGILLFCIIIMTTVNCILMKRRIPTTVEIERSPYIYDEIGTIDYRLTNIPPPIREGVVPGMTRRLELNRATENFFEDQISIETQRGQQDDVITDVNAADTTETRTYLSLPCSVRSSHSNNEEEIILTSETDNGNESVIEPQKSKLSTNKIKVLANDEHNNEIQFPLDQLVADININEHLVIDDSDSSNSDVPLAAVELETQNNLYEAFSSNTRLEHVYNQCENSSDPETQEVPKEYINLKIW